MNLYHITFRSVTFAQRGERLLQSVGIRCTLARTPKWMEEQGCGYCLQMRLKDPAGVVALLQQHRIPMRKVYRQNEEGTMEVWRP